MQDGDVIKLKLRPGAHSDTHPDPALRGKQFDRSVTGPVRSFVQDGETRWEVLTGDPQHPAIGFIPDEAEFELA